MGEQMFVHVPQEKPCNTCVVQAKARETRLREGTVGTQLQRTLEEGILHLAQT